MIVDGIKSVASSAYEKVKSGANFILNSQNHNISLPFIDFDYRERVKQKVVDIDFKSFDYERKADLSNKKEVDLDSVFTVSAATRERISKNCDEISKSLFQKIDDLVINGHVNKIVAEKIKLAINESIDESNKIILDAYSDAFAVITTRSMFAGVISSWCSSDKLKEKEDLFIDRVRQNFDKMLLSFPFSNYKVLDTVDFYVRKNSSKKEIPILNLKVEAVKAAINDIGISITEEHMDKILNAVTFADVMWHENLIILILEKLNSLDFKGVDTSFKKAFSSSIVHDCCAYHYVFVMGDRVEVPVDLEAIVDTLMM